MLHSPVTCQKTNKQQQEIKTHTAIDIRVHPHLTARKTQRSTARLIAYFVLHVCFIHTAEYMVPLQASREHMPSQES